MTDAAVVSGNTESRGVGGKEGLGMTKEAKMLAVVEALEDLMDVQTFSTGWDNGVTDPTGTINEGAHFHALSMDRARNALAAYRDAHTEADAETVTLAVWEGDEGSYVLAKPGGIMDGPAAGFTRLGTVTLPLDRERGA